MEGQKAAAHTHILPAQKLSVLPGRPPVRFAACRHISAADPAM